MVNYLRCANCGFVFTTHFDHLSDSEISARIYNADYILADPDFAERRPAFFAGLLADLLSEYKAAKCLDYGGGRGRLRDLMQAIGFCQYESFDPYFSHAPAPLRRYDLITSFEVAEHARDPTTVFNDISAMLKPDGTVLFSTQLQPRPLPSDWRYIAPRNGHVSIYTHASLRPLTSRVGLRFLSLNGNLHLAYSSPRSPIARTIARRYERSAMRYASMTDIATLINATRELAALGLRRQATNPKHPARLLWSWLTA